VRVGGLPEGAGRWGEVTREGGATR
jgi:hypothetical protein